MLNRHMRRSLFPFVALVFFLAAGLALHAQDTTSVAISGTVTDPTNALVEGATVKVTSVTTGVAHTSTTTTTGYYTEEALPPGDYSINVTKQGFKTAVVTGVHLDPGQRRGVGRPSSRRQHGSHGVG